LLRSILSRPLSVVIATLALVVLGFFSLLRLPVSLLPSLERPRLILSAVDGELPREEMLRRVVEPLERRLLSLRGVIEVRSTVGDGECQVVLESEWQTDVDRLRIDMERRLGETVSLGLERLEVRSEAGEREPILEIAVLGGADSHRRTLFADRVLLPELARLSGAGRLELLGGARRRPVVRPLAAALASRGLTALEVVERLGEVGASQPVGLLRDGAEVRPLVWREGVESLEALSDLRLGPSGARLGDVARITLEEVPDSSVVRLDGRPAVLVAVHRAPGANAVRLAHEVRRVLREITERGEPGLELRVLRDASTEVIAALRQLALAGLLGLVLGALVLRLVLRSWRPTFALVVVVPASLVAAFSGFYLWDVSLDIVSLAGLALAAGMLVDNSIVVLEAIESSRARGEAEPELEGSRQMATALFASFLTTAVVFLPLLYLRGLARAFFGVQAFAMVTALALSLVFSLSLTPVLARWAGRRGAGITAGRSLGVERYASWLEGSLRRPLPVALATVVLLVAGALVLGALPRALVQQGTTALARYEHRLSAGLAPAAVGEELARLERAAGETGEGLLAVYRGHDPRQGDFRTDGAPGRLDIPFESIEERRSGMAELARDLGGVAGVEGRLVALPSGIGAALAAAGRGLELEVTAGTQARVQHLARRFERHAAAAGVDLEVAEPGVRRPATVLTWNPLRLAAAGGEPGPLEAQLRAALGGVEAGRVDLLYGEPEILVEGTLPADPELFPVRPGALEGRVVPAGALARLAPEVLAPPWRRRDARPAVRLEVVGEAGLGGGALRTLQGAVASFPRAADEGVRLVGQAWEMRRSFDQLGLALGLALVLVFLTIAAIYESLTLPVVVMTTVPVAAAGAVLTLGATGQGIDVMSFLGLILLAGIVVNNAIVLLHRAEQRRDQGADHRSAVLAAARERYRPILMTTCTTLLGMIPLALVGGEGIELRRALALTVSGGLCTSLFAALWVVPVLYHGLRRR
jgi:HAE1 family hydrophobic/amphiphilic exporter-1